MTSPRRPRLLPRIAGPRRAAEETAPPPARSEVPPRLPPIEPQPPEAETPPWPDLLNPVRTLTVDAEKIGRALGFSFVAGNDGGALARALDRAPLAASSFEPTCFFEELFVPDLVRGCMALRLDCRPVRTNEAWLLRVLSQPPRDPRVTAQRRAVWAELVESPPLRAAFEGLYRKLRALVGLFEGDDTMMRGEEARRRIDILRTLHECFGRLGDPAFRSSSSCLSRLPAFADYVSAQPGFGRLEELLRYENERAYASLTLQLSADGRIRELHVVGVKEDVKNRYHVPWGRRVLGRLLLWFRGFRVSDGEIIDRWLDQVFEGVAAFLPPLIQLLGDLELYLAGLAFRDTCLARGLPVCFPEWAESGDAEVRLDDLYNPLLFALGAAPVPCGLALAEPGVTTLVTGPNSGGKTRLLQAVGLLHLLAHAGMFVPASRAVIRPVPGLFASLSQPVGAEASEGRLGTELARIRMLFERAEPGTVVLVDELCSGTSPSEGEELFRMVLELLRELRPVALISTHFLRFAADLRDAGEVLPLRFVRVELDARQRPTYRFVPGVAQTSLAHQTAARLGVSREELRAVLAAKALR